MRCEMLSGRLACMIQIGVELALTGGSLLQGGNDCKHLLKSAG